MPTDILCKQAASATFNASSKGVSKSLVSNKPPLSREDYPHLIIQPNSPFGGTTGVNQGDERRPLFQTGNNPNYRLIKCKADALSPNAQFRIYFNNVSIGVFSNLDTDINDPVGSIPIGANSSANISHLGTGVAFCNFAFVAYTSAWGHKVTDQAGQTEIFLTGHPTKPAPFTSSCGGQCPPGQVRCGDCCLDCKSIAGQIAAMGARL